MHWWACGCRCLGGGIRTAARTAKASDPAEFSTGLMSERTRMTKLTFDGTTPMVVGIGASAGGLDAFKKFFANMPVENGMAFVLIQHLDPHHHSMLVDLVGRQTGMTVVEAGDGMALGANRVFIIPPDATLTIKDGTLRLTTPAPPRTLRRPIDTFFSSLAEDQGRNAVCIVLAGTGSDGTVGLKAVKEHGGLTLVQAQDDHRALSGMPDSAAATGLVDHVLPVEAMPARLIAHRAHLVANAGAGEESVSVAITPEQLETVVSILRRNINHDFSLYKRNTLMRRVQRRMDALSIGDAVAFIEHLQKTPQEVELLFREILIGVTQFFRDPPAFEALRRLVFPALLANKHPGDQIRIWVPGCATGEEVYSIAILLKEAMAGHADAPGIQLFGTDIDDRAIARARTGRYRGPLPGVSPERLARWFTPVADDYCVAKEIRELCVFSPHSLIKDPPFSRLSLVSCRNVMIYFDQGLQDRVLRNFHYALAPGGFLFLGSSEGVTRSTTLFATVDKQHRIFERRDGIKSALPELSIGLAAGQENDTGGAGRVLDDRIDKSARRVIAKYSPAYVVIDAEGQIVRFSGGEAARFLEPSEGIASLNLFAILKKSFRHAARTAIRSARSKPGMEFSEDLTVSEGGQPRTVAVIAQTLAEVGPESALCLVAFRDLPGQAKAAASRQRSGGGIAPKQARIVADLESDLAKTKASLRAAIDDLESKTEEMSSSKEEFQSVNEELQASNEELETAKEEMQSINEELRTINAEMSDKNELLQSLNSDIRNLLDSTQIATIFLDADLRIKSFTPGMRDLILLRDSDQGRPLIELVSRLDYDALERDVTNVLATLQVVEREVRVRDSGAALVMRIRPYRTVSNLISGVVITFVDVTARKALEDALKESERRLAAIVDQASVGVAETDLEGRFTLVNPMFCRVAGRTERELLGLRMQDIARPDGPPQYATLFERLVAHGTSFEIEKRYERPDGSTVWVHHSVSAIVDAKGRVQRALAVVLDTTEAKRAEAHRELLLHELNHRVKNTLATVQSIASQTALGATTVEGYRAAFLARLMALAGTHNLLQTGDWHGALLRDVVQAELAPYQVDKARWTIEGSDVLLAPNMALAFGMAVHELTTNAAKYGALSNGEGRVDVSWAAQTRDKKQSLKFMWRETGGPPVSANRRKGFGTRLITEGLALQLDGTIDLDFKATGVQCSIDVPLPPAVMPA
jgi:two-component system, chemotaxis family, CheB/CheR fusion protein